MIIGNLRSVRWLHGKVRWIFQRLGNQPDLHPRLLSVPDCTSQLLCRLSRLCILWHLHGRGCKVHDFQDRPCRLLRSICRRIVTGHIGDDLSGFNIFDNGSFRNLDNQYPHRLHRGSCVFPPCSPSLAAYLRT